MLMFKHKLSEILIYCLFLSGIQFINLQQVNNNRDKFDKYTPIVNYDVSITSDLIISIEVNNRYDCFMKCSQNKSCLLVSIKNLQCSLYNQVNFNNFVTSPGSIMLFEKKNWNYDSINSYLKTHWSFNGNANDLIGNDNLYGGVSVSYSTDRLNKPSSALYLNAGYMIVPSDCYFCSDFTVSVWVKVISYRGNIPSQRLFDFKSADQQDLAMCDLYGGINFGISNAGSFVVVSAPLLSIGKWKHLTLTLEGSIGTIYVDGEVVNSGTVRSVRAVTKTINYVGYSNSPGANTPDAIIDDFKIFNRSLTKSEIRRILNSFY